MDKDTIFIDFTEGKKVFDTSKMDQWTQEEWKEWVGEPEDHVGVQTILFDDSDFYLKMTSLYDDEATNDMHITFEAQNKLKRNVSLQFGKWKVDDEEFDLSHLTPELLEIDSEMKYFKRSVDYMFLESTIIMEVTIIDVDHKTNLREFEFILKIY